MFLLTACHKTEKTSEKPASSEEASPKTVEQKKPQAANNSTNANNTNAFTEVAVTLTGNTLISSKDAYSEVSIMGKQGVSGKDGIAVTTQVGDNEFVLMLLFTNTTREQVEQVPFEIIQEGFLGKRESEKAAVVLSLTDYTQKPPKTYQMADGKATVEKFSEEEVIISFSGRVSANTGDLIKKENLQLITGKVRAKNARFATSN
ncbi:MAG: hypothetical protein AAF734_11815 [Bacteroidota bacterium]